MSQLRNLLTNKVVKYSLAGTPVARFRRTLRAHGRTFRSVRQEIADRAEGIEAHTYIPPMPKPQQNPGILRRVGNFLTRALKGS